MKETKYINETEMFLKSLNKDFKITEVAKKLGVSNQLLHNCYKNNTISKSLYTKIVSTYNLDEARLNQLKKIVLQ